MYLLTFAIRNVTTEGNGILSINLRSDLREFSEIVCLCVDLSSGIVWLDKCL